MRILRLLAGCSALVLAACDKASPIAPSGLWPRRLELSIAREIEPGRQATIFAFAHFDDGSRRDVTDIVSWHSSHPEIIELMRTSMVAHHVGESTIRATLSPVTASTEVIVVPADTFRVIGKVVEADTPWAVVPEARVESIGGGVAVSTTTGADGTYRLYGVAPGAQLRVTKEGYAPHTDDTPITSHQTVNIALQFAKPPEDVSGTYTLTITAAPECRSTLTAEARERRYTAIVQQSGVGLKVTLGGAGFFVPPPPVSQPRNVFPGRFSGLQLRFSLDGMEEDFAYVVEQISETRFFVPSGSVIASASSAGIAGTLDGALAVYEPGPVPNSFRLVESCRSNAHQFALVR